MTTARGSQKCNPSQKVEKKNTPKNTWPKNGPKGSKSSRQPHHFRHFLHIEPPVLPTNVLQKVSCTYLGTWVPRHHPDFANFTTLHNSSQLFTTLHNSSQLFTTLHNSSQLFTTLHNSSQLFTTLHNFSQLFTTLHIHVFVKICEEL